MPGKISYRDPMLVFGRKNMVKSAEHAGNLNRHAVLFRELPMHSFLKQFAVSYSSSREFPCVNLVASSRTSTGKEKPIPDI
jgi:hypothetical protein